MHEWWQICIFVMSGIFLLLSLGEWLFFDTPYKSEAHFWVQVVLLVLALYALYIYWPS